MPILRISSIVTRLAVSCRKNGPKALLDRLAPMKKFRVTLISGIIARSW
jgi:hypothetical protein